MIGGMNDTAEQCLECGADLTDGECPFCEDVSDPEDESPYED